MHLRSEPEIKVVTTTWAVSYPTVPGSIVSVVSSHDMKRSQDIINVGNGRSPFE